MKMRCMDCKWQRDCINFEQIDDCIEFEEVENEEPKK